MGALTFDKSMHIFETYVATMGDQKATAEQCDVPVQTVKNLNRTWGWDQYIRRMQGEVYDGFKQEWITEHKGAAIETVQYMRELLDKAHELEPESIKEVSSALGDLSEVYQSLIGAPNLRIQSNQQISEDSITELASLFQAQKEISS